MLLLNWLPMQTLLTDIFNLGKFICNVAHLWIWLFTIWAVLLKIISVSMNLIISAFPINLIYAHFKEEMLIAVAFGVFYREQTAFFSPRQKGQCVSGRVQCEQLQCVELTDLYVCLTAWTTWFLCIQRWCMEQMNNYKP